MRSRRAQTHWVKFCLDPWTWLRRLLLIVVEMCCFGFLLMAFDVDDCRGDAEIWMDRYRQLRLCVVGVVAAQPFPMSRLTRVAFLRLLV